MSSPRPVVLQYLGTPAVRNASGIDLALSAQSLRLLVRLSLGDGHGVGDGTLIEDLWSGREVGDTVLKAAMNRLRRALGDDGTAVRRTHRGYSLDANAFEVDASAFEQLVAAGRRERGGAAVDAFDQALALWRGAPFAGLADEEWLRPERERLIRLHRAAREDRAGLLIAQGRATEVLPGLVTALAEDPYRERSIELAVRALYLAGEPVQALGLLRSSVKRLREDLGIEPSGMLVDLEHSILSHATLLRASAPDLADDVARSIETLTRSAETMRRADAFEDAIRLVDRALLVARSSPPGRVAELLAQRSTLLALDERPLESLQDLAEATRLAREHDDARALAQVALTRFGFDAGVDDDDELLIQLLEPVELLAPNASERVDLLCAAVHQIAYSVNGAAAEKLLESAERAAAAVRDPRSAAVVSATRAAQPGLRHRALVDQFDAATSALDDARQVGDAVLSVAAHVGMARALFEAGRVDACAATLPDFRAIAKTTSLLFAWVRPDLIEAAVSLSKGETEGLEQQILHVRDKGRRMNVRSADGSANSLLLGTWLEEDRLELLESVLAGRGGSAALVWQAVGALVAGLLHRPDAGERLDAVVDACRRRGDGWRQPFVVAFALEAASYCSRADVAQALDGSLDLLEGRFLVLGPATITLGPIDRLRGLCALTLGDTDRAIGRLGAALAAAESGGAVVWAMRSRINLANALYRRDAAGDREVAASLLAVVAAAPLPSRSPRLRRELAEALASSPA